VLPCAIDYQTLVAARPRGDRRLRAVAADCGHALIDFPLGAAIEPAADTTWADYVRGVVQAAQAHGLPVQGAELAIAGDVPQGAGLSSSASLEVAVLTALDAMNGWGLPAATLARLAQRAENEFVGCQCGIMDPLISAAGRAGHALLIDCRSFDARAMRLPADAAVMIVHSGVSRGLVDGAYNERRAQCEAAAAHYRVPALRDLDDAALAAGAAGLDGVTLRRARHIVTENRRTLDAAEALAAGDLARLGTLMAASHASMRDDFEITVPAIDRLVAIVQQVLGAAGGARMTGGGFGGCVVALMPQARVDAVRAAIEAQYRAPDGRPATVWVCYACDGAGLVDDPLRAGARPRAHEGTA
jgi:galactokinase